MDSDLRRELLEVQTRNFFQGWMTLTPVYTTCVPQA